MKTTGTTRGGITNNQDTSTKQAPNTKSQIPKIHREGTPLEIPPFAKGRNNGGWSGGPARGRGSGGRGMPGPCTGACSARNRQGVSPALNAGKRFQGIGRGIIGGCNYCSFHAGIIAHSFSVLSSEFCRFWGYIFLSCQLSVISYQLSVNSYQLSVNSYQLSVISYQWRTGNRTRHAVSLQM
jgi:hypothetical protein